MAQEPPHWRAWIEPNEIPARGDDWISVSPNNRIWITSSLTENSAINWFDGYEIGSVPKESEFSLVREGSSGQIWALNYDRIGQKITSLGLFKSQSSFSNGRWLQYGLKDLQQHAILPMGKFYTGAINFLPGGANRLLILLLDRLAAFDAGAMKIMVLKKVEETNLGTFIHFVKTGEDGLWITAEKGLAKVWGNDVEGLPTIDSVQWMDFICPETLGLRYFAYPIPLQGVELLCTAFSIQKGKRVLVHFDGEAWRIIYSAGEEDVIMGWTDGDDRMWILKAEDVNSTFIPSRYNPSQSIDRLRLGIWISPTLMWLQNGKEHRVDRRKMLTGRILQVSVESKDVFWLGTSRGPVRHAQPTWRSPIGYPDMEKAVYSVCEDQRGRLWFTAVNVLYCLEKGCWQTYELPKGKLIPIHTVQSLGSLNDGRIVVVTMDGCLLTLKPGKEDRKFDSVVNPEGRKFFSIASRADGRLWVVTANDFHTQWRIELYDGNHFETIIEEKEFLPLGLPPQCLLETGENEFWFAKKDGIARYGDGTYRKFNSESEFLSGPFYSLTAAENGKIFAGGENRILEYDGKTWKTAGNTFLGNVNTIMKRRDGNIWAASQTGIHRYVEGAWISNTEEDGLPSDHCYTLFEDSQGRLWVGTISGIALYHPEADLDPPETYVPQDKNFSTALPKSEARFLYSGIDRWKYTQAERLLFSHHFDEDPWEPFTSNTVAMATGLLPGSHRFEVRAIDRNWNIDPTPAVFSFHVLQPWYKERVFLIIISFTMISITVLLTLHISNYFNLAKLVADRTKHLLDYQQKLKNLASELSLTEERERRRLAADLHDSVSQSLSLSIMELSEVNESKTIMEIKEQAASVRQRLKQTLLDTQNMTFDLCPPELYQIGLDAAIREMLVQMRKHYGIHFLFEGEHRPYELADDLRYFLFRTIRELLINVSKHAQAAHAWIKVHCDNDILTIQVIDDGIGFDSQSIAHDPIHQGFQGGFGLFNIQERLLQIEGLLTIESTPNEGARVSIFVPLKKSQEENPS